MMEHFLKKRMFIQKKLKKGILTFIILTRSLGYTNTKLKKTLRNWTIISCEMWQFLFFFIKTWTVPEQLTMAEWIFGWWARLLYENQRDLRSCIQIKIRLDFYATTHKMQKGEGIRPLWEFCGGNPRSFAVP